ncbi:Hpt domain-containing protein [Candidatus Accumulibacter cognatus]|uniref:Hpt domain protein n=1 Tax=Candidatus Accumulibacter cognatus TaxID=2954383 RepID=A0A080M9H8_9PROT|nr:Hpt domain-containing protein [Candidatus Accumulibacter cognatus]KFB77090.1 MAG: Hpt domain protein [Candidatus Accumulibacter cognatus]
MDSIDSDADATPTFDPSIVQSLPMVADGSNPEFADRVLDMFTRNATTLLAAIDSAMQQGDAKALQRSAHTLKSSSATVGAMALSEKARDLEMRLRAGELPGTDWPQALRGAYDDFASALTRHRAAAEVAKAT